MFEPFAGSLAVLLNRPHAPQLETANDACGFICNVWRAIRGDPDAVAWYADRPSNENDLHAIHSWLVARRSPLTAKLEGDMEYYNARIAGLWIWGICCWIGGGWCSGKGPWQVVNGELVRREDGTGDVRRQLPHLGNAGQGIQRKRPALGGSSARMGVHAQHADGDGLYTWMQDLSTRLRRVRVTCGDWTRVLRPAVTFGHGLTGMVLDPPYSHSERDPGLYAVEADIAPAVQAWCLANGNNPLLRIVLCGYEGEYDLPGWRVVAWKANGGMSSQSRERENQNRHRERLWCSPACLQQQLPLFGGTS